MSLFQFHINVCTDEVLIINGIRLEPQSRTGWDVARVMRRFAEGVPTQTIEEESGIAFGTINAWADRFGVGHGCIAEPVLDDYQKRLAEWTNLGRTQKDLVQRARTCAVLVRLRGRTADEVCREGREFLASSSDVQEALQDWDLLKSRDKRATPHILYSTAPDEAVSPGDLKRLHYGEPVALHHAVSGGSDTPDSIAA